MKKTSNILILIVLLINASIFGCFGQATELRGIVTDEENGMSLSEVRIFLNGKIQGATNSRGEFHISVPTIKKTDMIRFWKTGHVFQTFEISKIENKNEMKINLSKNNSFDTIQRDGREIVEIFLNNRSLQKEEWGDINKKEITSIDMKSADTGDMRTTKYIILYITTK